MILPSSDFPFRTASSLRGFGRRGYGWSPDEYWAPAPANYVETLPASAPERDNYVMAEPGETPTQASASGVGEFFTSLFTGLSTAFKPPVVRPVQQTALPQVAYPYQPGLAPPSAGLPSWALPTAAAVVGGGLLLFILTRRAPRAA